MSSGAGSPLLVYCTEGRVSSVLVNCTVLCVLSCFVFCSVSVLLWDSGAYVGVPYLR